MRNVFDQYDQPENRLTHALLCSLDADRALLQGFIRWVTGHQKPGPKLTVNEQSFPGESDTPPEEGDRRGIPDGCIADGFGWALLIESKLTRTWDADQLRRHRATAVRHGLNDVTIVCLTVGTSRQLAPEGCVPRSWSDVYVWLAGFRPQSDWAQRCQHYFEVAEAQLVATNGLSGGAITMFTGIPFGLDAPYSYLQAKRVLGLLRAALIDDKALVQALDIDTANAGRGAITGSKARFVWDYVGFKGAQKVDAFTQFPHLTLAVLDDRLEATLTVPNGVSAPLRRAMLGATFDKFEQRVAKVIACITATGAAAPGLKPVVNVAQRHYSSQRSEPVYDAVLRFDPSTAVRGKNSGPVKYQPQWLRLAYDVLNQRASNLQFQIGAEFPYAACPAVRTPSIAKAVASVWRACEPVLNSVRAV